MVFFVVLTYLHGTGSWNSHWWYNVSYVTFDAFFSPPARWGLLDFMSVASSSSSSSSFSSLFSSSFSSSSSPLFSSPLLVSSPRLLSSCSLPDFNHDHPRPVCPAGPQPRPSTPSVPCRTSTASIRAQCSLPDLNHDHPRPVFPAGPQPQKSRDKSFRQKWCQQAVLKCHGGDHSKQSNFYSILCVYLTYLYFMYIPSGYLK